MNIRRPAILFLASLILGIIVAYDKVPTMFLLLLFIIAIFLYGKLFIERKIKIKALLVIMMMFVIGFVRFKGEENRYNKYNDNYETLKKGYKELTGIVDSIGKSTNSNYYILKNVYVNNKYFDIVKCYVHEENDPHAKIGNKIKGQNLITKLEDPTNEGEFNQKNYNRSLGIAFTSYAKELIITDNNVSVVKQKIYETKVKIKEQIGKIFNSKDAGLFSAMITGDKSSIDKIQKKLFSDNGIAHILAISGLHLSILGLALFELLRKRFSVNVSAGVISIFILLYGIFIDAGPSSLRAIAMLYIRFISLCIGRTYDSKNTLYIICIVFLLLQPYLLFNAGFQFSYLAIFALNTEIHIRRNSYKKEIKIPAVITLTLFLFPVTIYHYFTYPLYSIILNLIVIPLMTFVLGFGLVGLLVSFVYIPLGKIIVFVVHIIFIFYDKLCNAIQMLPFHLLWIGKPSLYVVLYYYVSFFIIVYVCGKFDDATNDAELVNIKSDDNKHVDVKDIKNRNIFDIIPKNKIFRLVLCITLLIVSVLVIVKRDRSDFRMTFIDIGQGDSILVESNDMIITIDGGSSSNTSAGQYVLVPHIKSRAIKKVDYAFISHPDSDHINAIEYLLNDEEEVIINNLVLPINAKDNEKFDKIKLLAEENNVNIIYLKQGDKTELKKGLNIEIFNPNEKAVMNNINKKGKEVFDVNDLSLTFKMDYNNHSILFTGDIGKSTISRMVKDRDITNKLDVEVLKVPHHGSKNSLNEKFYEKLSPKYSIISYGRDNSYGHPHKDTIDVLSKYTNKILKTGESGQIDVYFDKEEINYKTFLR